MNNNEIGAVIVNGKERLKDFIESRIKLIDKMIYGFDTKVGVIDKDGPINPDLYMRLINLKHAYVSDFIYRSLSTEDNCKYIVYNPIGVNDLYNSDAFEYDNELKINVIGEYLSDGLHIFKDSTFEDKQLDDVKYHITINLNKKFVIIRNSTEALTILNKKMSDAKNKLDITTDENTKDKLRDIWDKYYKLGLDIFDTIKRFDIDHNSRFIFLVRNFDIDELLDDKYFDNNKLKNIYLKFNILELAIDLVYLEDGKCWDEVITKSQRRFEMFGLA